MNACQGIDNFEYNEYDCLIDEKKAIDGVIHLNEQ